MEARVVMDFGWFVEGIAGLAIGFLSGLVTYRNPDAGVLDVAPLCVAPRAVGVVRRGEARPWAGGCRTTEKAMHLKRMGARK
jgi:hypothetical protein